MPPDPPRTPCVIRSRRKNFARCARRVATPTPLYVCPPLLQPLDPPLHHTTHTHTTHTLTHPHYTHPHHTYPHYTPTLYTPTLHTPTLYTPTLHTATEVADLNITSTRLASQLTPLHQKVSKLSAQLAQLQCEVGGRKEERRKKQKRTETQTELLINPGYMTLPHPHAITLLDESHVT